MSHFPNYRYIRNNLRIDSLKKQDPGFDWWGSSRVTKERKTNTLRGVLLSVGLIITLSAGLFPLPVNAGLGDFISSLLFFKRQVPAETTSKVSEQALFLQAATNIDPNPAKGGGDITIIGGVALLAETGPSGSIADIEESTQSDQINIYVVREGDTLSGIAKMFGVSTNTILWANDLKRATALKVGQTLTILPVSGVRHTVKSGDTLASIAKKYKGDLEEIKEFNEISESTKLSTGTIIVVPHGVIEAAPVTTPKKPILAGGPAITGYFARPLSGGLRTQAIHGYNAVDLAAPQGTPIFASAPGTVIIAKDYGWNGGYGNYVVIKHDNGTQTLYAHMRNVQTVVGASVGQGDVIGTVGNTGRSTGPHLHFEVRGARNPFGY